MSILRDESNVSPVEQHFPLILLYLTSFAKTECLLPYIPHAKASTCKNTSESTVQD